MQYTVMLTKQSDASWRAVVPVLPECVAEAATREEALARIKERIAQAQQRVEFVQVEVPGGFALNGNQSAGTFEETWPYFGAFKGDPNWGAFFEELDTLRQ
jgi:hypothetical protein